MEILIETLKEALQKEGSLLSVLNRLSTLCWQEKYPVAVIHRSERIKDESLANVLRKNELLDENGFSPKHWNEKMIGMMDEIAPLHVKEVSILVHQYAPHTAFHFEEKREKDKWKKIVDDGSFMATLEHSVYKEGEEICQIESDLRDLMRSSKEIPSLKETGFIWMVEAPMDVEMDRVLAHYYGKNWMMVIAKQKTVYIGWHERLGSVDMRHFVCPPNK